jgi:hypothetical protein
MPNKSLQTIAAQVPKFKAVIPWGRDNLFTIWTEICTRNPFRVQISVQMANRLSLPQGIAALNFGTWMAIVCKLLLGIRMGFGMQISAQTANRLSLPQGVVPSGLKFALKIPPHGITALNFGTWAAIVCKLLLGMRTGFWVQISVQMANRLSRSYPLRQKQSVCHLGWNLHSKPHSYTQ